jgi:glucokinase
MLIGLDLEETSSVPAAQKKFPQPGSLESLAAGRELDRLGAEVGLGRGPEIVAAAEKGDAKAIEAIELLGHRLGIGISNAINMFDPEEVVIGGGVSNAGDLLLDAARESALQYVLPGVGTRTTIRLAKYGPTAGVRGAALLAGQEVSNS